MSDPIGKVTQPVHPEKIPASGPDVSETKTPHDGKTTLDGLRLLVISEVANLKADLSADAEAWRKKHDVDANERNGSLLTAITAYQTETRAEIMSLKVRVNSIESHGVPAATTRMLRRVANVVLACAIVYAIVSCADVGVRLYSVIYAPVLRAPR